MLMAWGSVIPDSLVLAVRILSAFAGVTALPKSSSIDVLAISSSVSSGTFRVEIRFPS